MSLSAPTGPVVTSEVLFVRGGRPLKGVVKAAGAKNSITKLLVASLLSDKRCLFRNVPNIGDVAITVELCRSLGSIITWDKAQGILEISTPELLTTYVPQRFSGSNRIPILMIGALLGRCGADIIVPTMGGCQIGQRPVDFHIDALEKLGAKIEYRVMKKEGAYFAHAHGGLHGAHILLSYPSVGATENALLATVRAKGVSIIQNAAIEPEIIDLILFLQKLGAIITLEGDRRIRVQGVDRFYDVEHTVVTDRVEVASFAAAAIATKGHIFVEGAQQLHLVTFLNKLREVGGAFCVRPDGIEFAYDGPLKGGLHLETDVHPGFATDFQQPLVVMLTQAHGTSIVHETVYEKRFGYTSVLKEMGANISLFRQCLGSRPCRHNGQDFDHSIVIQGPTPLQAKAISIPDLRAGFAYVLAALMAKGESTITGLPFLDRGYANLDEKLIGLGADIQRVSS